MISRSLFAGVGMFSVTSHRALLKEILQASSNGMQALDKKMEDMIAGREPRYTPEFLSEKIFLMSYC